nr:serine/threonine protein kinase [Ardenticatenales bacterium]
MTEISAFPTHIPKRYNILKQIGEGGFASVYMAHDNKLNRQVAIKVYHPQEEEDAAKLGNEAQILANLRHPNIVTVFDAAITDNQPYIVMEYLEGGSLREKLGPNAPPMRPQDALGLVAILAEALAAAHEADILHLDIKPENIIFDKRGRPYLTDFGIGRIMGGDGETRQTRAMGTNNYASPEQRQGGKLSRASDIYSLGVVLFELLTNQIPLGPAAASPQPPYSPPFPMNHPITAAKDLVLLVCKALSVAPNYRYESAMQFAHQLRDYISHASEHTGRLSAPSRSRQFAAPSLTRVQIREPERQLRPVEIRHLPQTVRELDQDLPPVPSSTRVANMIYSHQGLEVGSGSLVEQAIFGRGKVRLRQDAVVRGDVMSLTAIDVSQGVQAANLLAPELIIRGPIRLEGSIFCRRLRPFQNGFHLPDNSELGGSLIFGQELEKIVPDAELGRALAEPRPPIEIFQTLPDVRIGTQCTLVAILGDVNVEVESRQKQLNTIRVKGNVKLGRSNHVRRIEGEDIHIGPSCVVDEVHAHGKLVIEQGSKVGYARAGKGIELANEVIISSPILFSDNGAILEQGEARWGVGEETSGLTAAHLFNYEREGKIGSLATILLDHRLYALYERIAPDWMPRIKPRSYEGSGDRVRMAAQLQPKQIGPDGE